MTARASVALDPGLTASFADTFRPGMRTADFLASEWWCGADPRYRDFCEVEDQHRSTPQNIGDILDLPMGQDSYRVEQACALLLDAGRDQDCQRNSLRNRAACPGAPVLRSYGGDRTEATGKVAWCWTVAGRDGVYVIGGSQPGYRGYSEGPGVLEPEAAGCLRYGRLLALAVGDVPLRSCRPQEVTIPAGVTC